MKRSLLWIAGLFLVLFGVITLVRERGPREAATKQAQAEASRDTEPIRSFWETYRRATRERLARDYESAVRDYREALEIDPRHQDSLFFLATSLEATGRYVEAVVTLRELTSIYPEHARGWSQLGKVLATKAPGAAFDLDAADAAFTRAQEINQEHSGPFVRRGLVALERGQFSEAGELFDIAAGTGAPEGIFFAGFTDYLQGRRAEAARSFRRVLALSEHEKKLAGRGVSSEGDVSARAPSALERSRLRSLLFLHWSGEDEAELEEGEARFETRLAVKDENTMGAWLDYDRDGRIDLVLTSVQGITLLRNTGDGWSDVSADVGLDSASGARNACPFDADGDGWTDLYFTGDTSVLYLYEEGRFVDRTAAWGLAGERVTTRALAADLDGDGRTDLLELGEPPVRLYLRGDTGFEKRSLNYTAYAVDAAVGDVDSDGRLDVFVLGWRSPGRLFRGTVNGFKDVTIEAGLEGVGGAGLSTLLFDYDRDGDLDLLVTAHATLELSLRRLLEPARTSEEGTPRLFKNDGQGHFLEVTSDVGLDRHFGVFQAAATDVDSDGWDDLVFAHGGFERTHLEPSVILRNREGRSFVAWAYLPSVDDPRRALGVAASADELFLSGIGILERSR